MEAVSLLLPILVCGSCVGLPLFLALSFWVMSIPDTIIKRGYEDPAMKEIQRGRAINLGGRVNRRVVHTGRCASCGVISKQGGHCGACGAPWREEIEYV